MKGIEQLGFLLCTVSLLSMLVQYVLPKTGLAAAVKACTGVLFAAAFVGICTDLRLNVSFDFSKLSEQTAQRLEVQAQKQTLCLTENAVSEEIYRDLKKEGYPVKNVSVHLHTASDGSIEISKIILQISEREEAVSAYVEQRYGVSPILEDA